MKNIDIKTNINLTLMAFVRPLKISCILTTVLILEEEIFRKSIKRQISSSKPNTKIRLNTYLQSSFTLRIPFSVPKDDVER